MIVTVDGYDGTGKTTLAKNIEKAQNFCYIEKPFILKFQDENKTTVNTQYCNFKSGSIKNPYSLGCLFASLFVRCVP